MIRHNDHRASENDIGPEGHITRHSQVVELDNVWDLGKPAHELLNLRGTCEHHQDQHDAKKKKKNKATTTTAKFKSQL